MSASEWLVEIEPTRDSWGVEVLYPHQYEPLIEAIKAVLAIPERGLNFFSSYSINQTEYGNGQVNGYNQCLVEVKALIEGKVGNE